jgi:hypothetical protein
MDRLPDAMVLETAGQLGLNEQQTVKLFSRYQKMKQELAQIEKARADARKGIDDAIAAGRDADVSKQLESLRTLDTQASQARRAAAMEMGDGLTPAQQARVYLAVSDMPPPGHPPIPPNMMHGYPPPPPPPPPPGAVPPPPPPAPAPAATPDSPAKVSEQALAMVKKWIEAAKAKNVDAMMSVFSDKFSNVQYGDKAGMKDFLKQAMDMGYLDDVKVKMDKAEVQMKDGKASIYPIDIEGTFGSATLEFVAVQENGEWKLIGLDISGV